MRADEQAQLREQKKHLIAEFRSLTGRYDDGKAWNPEDAQRRDHLIGQVERINEDLAAQHKRELEEIRSGGGNSKFSTTGYERSFSPEPLYQAFRSAGFARGEPAQIPWTEFRSITWTGSVDNLSQPRRPADMLGYEAAFRSKGT